ncbi:MAG: GyrI-like domain-containing protein [Deltaproteobacteria bacterium]|jgi:predicted transcriptional regulator YdeE|nr:GyrI-like domain-containing protein [Deltaproteobacteria bacterium]
MAAIVTIDEVEVLAKKQLVGYCAIMDSSQVSLCYDRLWSNFLERLSNIDLPHSRNLYGVCNNLNCNSGFFEYWTAIETLAGDQLPDDLVNIPLSAGTYGCGIGDNDRNLPTVYSRMIEGWSLPAEYILNSKEPFFEIYRPDWFHRMAVRIFVPLQVLNMEAEGCLG